MESALKQRLLGALVLIALAVIFVPMFLSGPPPKHDTETISLDIPAPPERKFETRVLPVDGNTKPVPVPAAIPAAESDRVVTVDTHAPAKIDAKPEVAAKIPSASEPVNTTSADTHSASVKPVTEKPAPSSVTPIVEKPLPAIPDPSVAGRFAVHLGVYADRAHADALVANMQKLGLSAYIEATNYEGKSAQRVRVGPYGTRAVAEAARLQIKQFDAKLPSSVVESPDMPKIDAPESAIPANHAGGWAVQLGAFKAEEEANKLRDRLRNASFVAFVDKLGAGEQTLWRVRAGPEVERANAEKLRTSIKQKFQIDGLLVTQP